MLHGLPGGAEDWNRLASKLATDFHVVAIDRPGYGGSGADPIPVSEQTALYAELLESVGTTQADKAMVIGHSYGAVPAAELAARRPDLIGAAGLLAPALREMRSDREPPPGTAAIERLLSKPAVASFVQATILSEAGRTILARLADPTAFAPDPVDPEHLAGVRDRTLQWGALRSFLAEAKILARDAEMVDGLLGTLIVPAAVIHARGDRVVDLAAGQRTARSIPHCAMHEIEGGHMLTVSRADEVAGHLRTLAIGAGLIRGPAAT